MVIVQNLDVMEQVFNRLGISFDLDKENYQFWDLKATLKEFEDRLFEGQSFLSVKNKSGNYEDVFFKVVQEPELNPVSEIVEGDYIIKF